MKTLRHKTAIRRLDLSRPVRIALDTRVIEPDTSVFDFGCGRGGDLERLRDAGIECRGWDPHHRPNGSKSPADVVNLGFVLNVIEDPRERAGVLKEAWSLAQKALLVAVRPTSEARSDVGTPHGDGVLTERGTFQKFFDQLELRAWVEGILDAKTVPVEPGVVFVFREEADRHDFEATRFRRVSGRPRVRQADRLHSESRQEFEVLLEFYAKRGRVPRATELPEADELAGKLGSINHAFHVLRRVHGREELFAIEDARREDLLVFLALDRLGGRAKFSELSDALRWDVRAHFSSYKNACKEADQLLFAAGNPLLVDAECRDSPVGKLTPDGLYIHRSALESLAPVLRVLEGCARALMGDLGANIIKIGRQKPQVSYSHYPDFDREPHPALAWSYNVDLRALKAMFRDYRDSSNPPILHRKELFVGPEYPEYEKFERFTKAEERWGLLDEPHRIGNQAGWERVLEEVGVELRGHRVVRRS